MGREQVIDITSWDANRETLMESILTAQAKQNPGFKKIVLKHANKGLREDSMGDTFWPTALAGVWKNVRANLEQDDEGDCEDEDDEGQNDEDEDDGYGDDAHKISSSQGRKCPAKRARSS